MATKKEDIVDEIMAQHKRLAPAAEELRKKLNGVVAEYELGSENVIMILARLCAGYIHQTQKMLDKAGYEAPDIMKESFLDMLTAYLTSYDMSEINTAKMDEVN
jgi:hypothetical protein